MLNNRALLVSISLVLIQQLLLGASTYLIANAGAYLAAQDTQAAVQAMCYFFMLALTAYLVSGADKLVVVRAKQHICTEYFIRFFNKIHNNQGYNSKHGKIQTIAWLSGEVRQTLTAVIDFINQAWSLYLHILITFLVFYQTVGAVISLIILACFALSALLVLTSRQRIQKLSHTNQADNIKLNEALPVQWDYALFGNASRHRPCCRVRTGNGWLFIHR